MGSVNSLICFTFNFHVNSNLRFAVFLVCVCVFSAQLSPENAEEYIDYLRSVGRLDEAAVRLAAVVNDEGFVSKEGKSNYQVGVCMCVF